MSMLSSKLLKHTHLSLIYHVITGKHLCAKKKSLPTIYSKKQAYWMDDKPFPLGNGILH